MFEFGDFLNLIRHNLRVFIFAVLSNPVRKLTEYVEFYVKTFSL